MEDNAEKAYLFLKKKEIEKTLEGGKEKEGNKENLKSKEEGKGTRKKNKKSEFEKKKGGVERERRVMLR